MTLSELFQTLCEPFRVCNGQTTNPPSPSRRGVCCTTAKPVTCSYEKEPAIVLKNHSKYEISFWVFHGNEDATTRMAKKKPRDMCGLGCRNSVEPRGGNKEDTEVIEGCFTLTEDERVDDVGTTVPFPVDCTDLCILGFFRENSSQSWKQYKNQVYSIDGGDMIFTLVARDDNIARHLKHVSVCVCIYSIAQSRRSC